jgi:hypothetical protein
VSRRQEKGILESRIESLEDPHFPSSFARQSPGSPSFKFKFYLSKILIFLFRKQ